MQGFLVISEQDISEKSSPMVHYGTIKRRCLSVLDFVSGFTYVVNTITTHIFPLLAGCWACLWSVVVVDLMGKEVMEASIGLCLAGTSVAFLFASPMAGKCGASIGLCLATTSVAFLCASPMAGKCEV